MENGRRKIVGVMGSGTDGHADLSRCVGRTVAELGCHLLTGGGAGVMDEVSRAFCKVSPREGICIGILKGKTSPASGDSAPALVYTPSHANRSIELPIYTHLPLSGSRGREDASRNHINVLSSDVLVALPGGSGTYSEVTLRIDYGRRVILFLGNGRIAGYTAKHFRERARDERQVLVAESADELKLLLGQALGHREAACAKTVPVIDDDPLSRKFTFPDLQGKNVLIVGVGGGCDIISAFALAEMLKSRGPAKLVYANTKTRRREQLERRSAHIFKVPDKRIELSPGTHTHGTTLIDQSVPRGDDNCPLILHLPESQTGRRELVSEIRDMSFDMVITVDTGADSIVPEATSGPYGRDRRMMELIASTGAPGFHVVVAPGCDGETTLSELLAAVRELELADRYRGCFSIEPWVPLLRQLAAPLKRKRTPNIIADACAGLLDVGSDRKSWIIPRGKKPQIPKLWLSTALVVGLKNMT